MIRIASALVIASFAMLSASCCCTGEPKPPKLRALPNFQELPAAEAPAQAPAPVVIDEK